MPSLKFRNQKGDDIMNTIEILTLILVIFNGLIYIDNHNKKEK